MRGWFPRSRWRRPGGRAGPCRRSPRPAPRVAAGPGARPRSGGLPLPTGRVHPARKSRGKVDWWGTVPSPKPKARRTAGRWRAPHWAMARTDRWFARSSATASARIAGKAKRRPWARRGSWTAANAPSRSAGGGAQRFDDRCLGTRRCHTLYADVRLLPWTIQHRHRSKRAPGRTYSTRMHKPWDLGVSWSTCSTGG